jgi:Transcriptional regulatory protein, C terminal
VAATRKAAQLMIEEVVAYTLGPVPSQAFAGRRKETEAVLRRAFYPAPPLQSLEGASKIGRTSMLHHLRAISRGEIPNPALRGHEGRLIAPWIDLTLRHHDARRADTFIYRAILEEIREHGLSVPNLPDGGGASAVVAARMEELTEAGYSFLLLVDRVEHLLTTTKGFNDPPRQMWRKTAMNALAELNERIRIAVLLAFGATGPAREVRPGARRLKMVEALDVLSNLLTRGNVVRIELGLLDEKEVRDFVERANRLAGGSGGKLTPTEVDWLVNVAGGHPLVMQNAALRLLGSRDSDAAGGLREVERELAEPALFGFMVSAFHRIDPIDQEDLAPLEDLSRGEMAELRPELVEILEDEALVQRIEGSNMVAIPSPALQGALFAYLARRRSDEVDRRSRRPQPSVRSSRATLALTSEAEGSMLRLTPIEHLLIKGLLAAGDDVASREELKAALGPDADDAQLNQRISVLRSKIRDSFDIPDAIVSVYGEGYRFDEPRRYELRNP